MKMPEEKSEVEQLREDVDRKLGVLEHNMLEIFKDWAGVLRAMKKELELMKDELVK